MKRAQTLLVSILLAVTALGASTQGAFAHTGDVWTNSNAFTSRCLGFNDTYPAQLDSLARTQMAALGYSPLGGAIGSGFNTTAFLGHVLADWGVYVHSHGDNYWATSGAPNVDSAFLQDPGPNRCNVLPNDTIRASAIKSATRGSQYNLVIMSTCFLGSASSTMPNAFQIEKVKNNTQREFYLGYVYETYDSASLRFENAFWSYISGSPPYARRTLYSAFIYASSIGGYESPNS
ncbi:MAG TPA: hypothetical protein VF337_09090 [Candidatus Limnocylindrales bacterium]